MDNAAKTELELMIDKHGMRAVLLALTDIAYEKAEHVMTNYQDKPLAKAWESAARAVNRAVAQSSVS